MEPGSTPWRCAQSARPAGRYFGSPRQRSNTEASIVSFIDAHRPLPDGVSLPEADFWSPSQAAFFRESIQADADWAEVVDQLNLALRG